MSNPIIRLSRPSDINNIVSLDSKCYIYPFKIKDWQDLVQKSGHVGEPRLIMLEILDRPVGFCMWNIDHEARITNILRMAVLEKNRRFGLGRLLLTACDRSSLKAGVEKLRITVPDIHCRPGDPDDVSEFLLKTGFLTTGDIQPAFKQMYGDPVDGYVFERRVTI